MDLLKLHDYFCQYLSIERDRTDRTVVSYRYNFSEFMGWLKNSNRPLDTSGLDYAVLREFMYYLAHRVQKKTVRQRMLSLKSFCKYLVREDVLQRNPFDRFDIPKKEKSLPKPLSNVIRDKLLLQTRRRALKTQKDRDIQAVVIVELGMRCGFRKGAMRNLLWENADLKGGYAYVIDKGQKEKCCILAPSAVLWLKTLKLARGAEVGPVLLSPRSRTAISITSLHDEFKRYVKLAGLPENEVSLHRLRHTFGTNLFEKGMDIREVQEALGHEDIGSTLGYVEVSKKNLREKIKRAFSNEK